MRARDERCGTKVESTPHLTAAPFFCTGTTPISKHSLLHYEIQSSDFILPFSTDVRPSHELPLLLASTGSRLLQDSSHMSRRLPQKDAIVKLIVGAGQASPSPPVGPALGSKGVKSIDFCKVKHYLSHACINLLTTMPGVQRVDSTSHTSHTYTCTHHHPPRSFLFIRATDATYIDLTALRGGRA